MRLKWFVIEMIIFTLKLKVTFEHEFNFVHDFLNLVSILESNTKYNTFIKYLLFNDPNS